MAHPRFQETLAPVYENQATTAFEPSRSLLEGLYELGSVRGRLEPLVASLDGNAVEAVRNLRARALGRAVALHLGAPGLEEALTGMFLEGAPGGPRGADEPVPGLRRLEDEGRLAWRRALRRSGALASALEGARSARTLAHLVAVPHSGPTRSGPDRGALLLQSLESWLALNPPSPATAFLGSGVLLANLGQLDREGVPAEVPAVWVVLRYLRAAGLNPGSLLTLAPLFTLSPSPLAALDDGCWAGDLTRGLERYLEVLIADQTTLFNLLRGWKRRQVARGSGPRLNDRQRRALDEIDRAGNLTNRDYRRMFGVSNKTAHQELRYLADRKLVQRVGRGRAVCYRR